MASGGRWLGCLAPQGLVEPEGEVAVLAAGFPEDTPRRTQRRDQLPILREKLAEQIADELVPPLARVLGGEGLVERQGKRLLHHTRIIIGNGIDHSQCTNRRGPCRIGYGLWSTSMSGIQRESGLTQEELAHRAEPGGGAAAGARPAGAYVLKKPFRHGGWC